MSPEAFVELERVFCVHRGPDRDTAPLQGASLSVGRGESVCVLGPSGAGKSTLLRVIAGLQLPAAGVARVAGLDIGRIPARSRAKLRREQIGFLGQSSASVLSPDLPVERSVALPLLLRGEAGGPAARRAGELLEAAGLGGQGGDPPARLSGGERQRAAVCAAIVHRPALLLADEPTGDLDRAGADGVRELILALARSSGATVILVSHDPASGEHADRTMRMRDGRIESEVSAGEVRQLVDRSGWMRVPAEHRRALTDRVRVSADRGGVRLEPAGASSAAPRPRQSGRLEGSAAPVLVTARDVVRVHRDGRRPRPVLERFSVQLATGCLTAVTGPSGVGKSTLLRLLAGLEQPDSGEITHDGTALAGAGEEQRARLRRERLGYLAQDPCPVGFLSAHENVVLALRVRGWAPDAAARRAHHALEAVELSERAWQRADRLSAGESQRVGIARALAAANGLLILDEPTSRLDEASAGRIAAVLGAAGGAGHTVVCATHDDQLLERAEAVLSLSR